MTARMSALWFRKHLGGLRVRLHETNEPHFQPSAPCGVDATLTRKAPLQAAWSATQRGACLRRRSRPVLTRLLRKTRPGETWSRFTDHAGVDFALKRAPPGRVRPCRAIVVADRPRPNIRVTTRKVASQSELSLFARWWSLKESTGLEAKITRHGSKSPGRYLASSGFVEPHRWRLN
jgi:hypothetical protein